MKSGNLISYEANAMETVRKVLMLLVIVQAIPLAHADDSSLANAGQDASKRLPRPDYLSAGFFARREKAAEPPAYPAAQSNAAEFSSSARGQDPSSSLHWVPSEQRPTVEYRFSKDGTMRLHMNRHGVEATMGWHF